MTIDISLLKNQNPFLQLSKPEMSALSKSVGCKRADFNITYKEALAVMTGKKERPQLTPEALQVLEELNSKAQEILQKNPFRLLTEDEKTSLVERVSSDFKMRGMDQERFLTIYRTIFEQNSPEGEKILEALNAQVQQLLDSKDPFVQQFKMASKMVVLLDPLFRTLNRIIWGEIAIVSALCLFYLRSHRVIAGGNGFIACALFIFNRSLRSLHRTLSAQAEILKTLSTANRKQVIEKTSAIYEELRRANYLMAYYTKIRERKSLVEHKSLIFFIEHLAAFQHVNNLKDRLFYSCLRSIARFIKKWLPFLIKSPKLMLALSSLEAEAALTLLYRKNPKDFVDLKEIQQFFTRFERVCYKGKMSSLILLCLGMISAFYTLKSRAYLIASMSVLCCGGQLIALREWRILQNGSKNVTLVEDVKIEEAFQTMAQQSFFFRMLRLQKAPAAQIRDAIVIPLNAILKLAPAWKCE